MTAGERNVPERSGIFPANFLRKKFAGITKGA